MNALRACSILLLGFALIAPAATAEPARVPAAAPPPGMALIPAGDYRPAFLTPGAPAVTPVRAFYLDLRPVTNAQFLAFVRANPAWRRSQVKPIFADRGYLAAWAGDLDPGPKAPPGAPATEVSWFAAAAYCRWIGRRLPTRAEWEYAAISGTSAAAATRVTIAWYEQPVPPVLPSVQSAPPDAHGIRGLIGFDWEWVSDFNTALFNGDSRGDSAIDRNFFCGGAALSATDKENYAAFLREAFRSSLEARYTVRSLGFRTAADAP